MSHWPKELRRRVQERARHLCEYCRTLMELTGHGFTTTSSLKPEAARAISITYVSAASGATITSRC